VRISLKLSIAFCIAAIFLLLVEVTAALVVLRLNDILEKVRQNNVQLDQIANTSRAYRLTPNNIAEHRARLGDLEKWANTEDERRQISELRLRLEEGTKSGGFALGLEDLGAYYRKANDTAYGRLIIIHERVVLGLVVIMIISILLFTGLTWLVRAWLLNPVRDLGSRLGRIAAGEWQLAVLHQRDPEFQDVVKPINALLADRQQAVERLERTEQLAILGDACSQVTNNVRTQLGSIRTLAQYESKATGSDPSARAGFQYIIASLNKLDTWLRDFASAAQPIAPRPAVQQLEPIIRDTLAMVQPRFTDRGITSEFKPADDVPAVPVDRSLFEQALAALLNNAIEASSEAATVVVTTAAGPDGTATVHIEDYGAGMSDEVRQRAFEPYFTTKPGSAGLGLTMTQWVIQRHGGTIELDSTPKKGTRITLRLPAAKKP
jgi:signal transduction histidine kinase